MLEHKLPTELKAKWLTALRDGTHEKGRGHLKYDEPRGTCSFCCLGVLVDVYAPDKWGYSVGRYYIQDPEGRQDTHYINGYLHDEIIENILNQNIDPEMVPEYLREGRQVEWSETTVEKFLAMLNDDIMTENFEPIAAWIEEHL